MHLQRLSELLSPFLTSALSDAQLALFAAYLEVLLRWNARMNLTAVRDPEQVVTRHFGESLFAAQNLFPQRPATSDQRLLDIGSGAGFPGLPIKIWRPELHVTLIESRNKKSTFLKEVIRTLDLRDISVSTSRAEDYDRNAGVSPAADFSTSVSPSGGARRATQSRDLVFPAATVTLRAVEKFDRILPTAARLAAGGRLALLIGATQVPVAQELLPTFTWADPLPIPQSQSRVLLIGHASS